MDLDSRCLFLGDTLTPADAGLLVYRAFPGRWFLHHEGQAIGPFGDKTILRALRVACTPTIDGCELGPTKLAIDEFAPRQEARPGPRWTAFHERDLPPSVTTYTPSGLEPVSGCCTTFAKLPAIVRDDSIAWEAFLDTKPSLAGRLKTSWNAHPVDSPVFVPGLGVEHGVVIVDVP